MQNKMDDSVIVLALTGRHRLGHFVVESTFKDEQGNELTDQALLLTPQGWHCLRCENAVPKDRACAHMVRAAALLDEALDTDLSQRAAWWQWNLDDRN